MGNQKEQSKYDARTDARAFAATGLSIIDKSQENGTKIRLAAQNASTGQTKKGQKLLAILSRSRNRSGYATP